MNEFFWFLLGSFSTIVAGYVLLSIVRVKDEQRWDK